MYRTYPWGIGLAGLRDSPAIYKNSLGLTMTLAAKQIPMWITDVYVDTLVRTVVLEGGV